MKLVLLTLALLISANAEAQSLDGFNYLKEEYNERTFIDINPTYTLVRNSEAPYPEAHSLNGWSGSLTIRKVDFNKGSWRYQYEHRLLFDLLLILHNMVDGDGSYYYRSESSGLTTGIVGWWSFGRNIISKTNVCVNVGANINDYFLSSSYRLDSIPGQDLTSLEPQGYWFAGGPAVMADFRISNNFLIHLHGAYSMGFWRAVSLSYGDTQVDDNYPNPYFGAVNAQLQTRWGIFAGVSYNWLINRGNIPNSTSRTDFQVGFKLPL